MTASFDSNLADMGNHKYGNLADTYAELGLTPSPDAKAKGGRDSRSIKAIALARQVD